MKQACCRHPRASRGITALIEIIIVLVIILGGMSLYFGLNRSAGTLDRELDGGPSQSLPGQPQSLPGKVIRRAEGVECQSNLRQLRMMVDADKDQTEEGGYPPSLQAIQGASKISQCPIGNVPYTYDPSTGKVSCAYPGHENY
ncbi:MAG: hypothetical protein ACYC7E_05585 [Armatimonadota bacterium]